MDEAWVIWMTLLSLITLPQCLTLRTSSGESQATHLRLMTKATDGSDGLLRRGPSIRENEIAAIFRGVAYGAPTQGRPNDTVHVPAITQTIAVSLTPSSVATSAEPFSSSKFTSAIPVVHENDPIESKHVSPKNRTFVTKFSHEVHHKHTGNEIHQSERETKTKDIVSTTYTPLATIRTVYDKSSSVEEKKIENRVNGSKSSGVWISGFPSSVDGLAWSVHVYVTVGLFTLMGLVSLCLMARVALCTHLLPRPHYLSLHTLIFCASFARSLDILLESHDMKYVLPITLLMALREFGWPCLTAALAVLLVAILKEWRYPNHPHRALILYLLTGLHLVALPSAHLSVLWLEHEYVPIVLIMRALSTGWSGLIGIGGLWAVWRESRNDITSQSSDIHVNNGPRNLPSITHPSRFLLSAALTQLLLAGLHFCNLIMPKSHDSYAWVLWSVVTVSRALELIVGITLLTAAALTLTRQNYCNVFGTCCQKRTVEIVHPAEIKMIHPMGVYTLQPSRPKNEHAQTIAALSLSNPHKEKRDRSSLDYVTSDFQLVWNHSRHRPPGASQTLQNHISDDNAHQICPDKPFTDIPSGHVLSHKTIGVIDPFSGRSAFTAVLPRNRMYSDPQSCLPLERDLKSSQEGINFASRTSTLLSGGSSGSSKLYASPQVPLRPSRSWDEISTGHIYEDLGKTKHSSVDEGLSDLSDLNSDNMNDLLYSDTGSPVLIKPARKQQRRNYAASYIKANYRKQNCTQPSSNVSSKQRKSDAPVQEYTHLTSNRISLTQSLSSRQNSSCQPAVQQNSTQHSLNRQSVNKQPVTRQSSGYSSMSRQSHMQRPSLRQNTSQQSGRRQKSTQTLGSHQLSPQSPMNEYCPDLIPTNTQSLISDLAASHTSSNQQISIHTPTTRTHFE